MVLCLPSSFAGEEVVQPELQPAPLLTFLLAGEEVVQQRPMPTPVFTPFCAFYFSIFHFPLSIFYFSIQFNLALGYGSCGTGVLALGLDL